MEFGPNCSLVQIAAQSKIYIFFLRNFFFVNFFLRIFFSAIFFCEIVLSDYDQYGQQWEWPTNWYIYHVFVGHISHCRPHWSLSAILAILAIVGHISHCRPYWPLSAILAILAILGHIGHCTKYKIKDKMNELWNRKKYINGQHGREWPIWATWSIWACFF